MTKFSASSDGLEQKNQEDSKSNIELGLTFEDVLLLPQHSEILPGEVKTTTYLTDKIKLSIPILSAAMDTVTESSTAIKLAQLGGIGIIHKNMSIDQQALEVRKVKKSESGIIVDPITISADISLAQAIDVMKENQISGLPVVDKGKLVGILTNRDIRFETKYHKKVSEVMTTQLITIREHENMDQAKEKLRKHKIEKLLVVNEDYELCGMITIRDIENTYQNPLSGKDSLGRLIVGAAVGVSESEKDRVKALEEAGVDVVVIDTAHGHSLRVANMTRWVKKHFPNLQVIAGNIATGEAAQFLAQAGADAVKVGIGPGSICTTRIVAGVGVPQLTAIEKVASALKGTKVKIIADGGLRYSGDVVKALAFGAHTVMMGNMFAGTDEAPGDFELYQGKRYKTYRGMGSISAMQKGSADRYAQSADAKLVPEGIEGRVAYKGPLSDVVHQLVGGLRAGMGYSGALGINELRSRARFTRISHASLAESHVHDVYITKEAPNYRPYQ